MAADLKAAGFELVDADGSGVSLVLLTSDPTIGGGVLAEVGSLGLRNNSGSGEIWKKTGVPDIAWTQLSGPSFQAFRLVVNNGLSEFDVTMPATMPTDDYVVRMSQVDGSVLYYYQVPEAARTETQFHVILSSACEVGASFDVFVAVRDPDNDVTIEP